jgi:penicillin-binding protein 1A
MPETLVNDMPLSDIGHWSPSNSDGSTDGPVTLRHALTRSKNLVSIRLLQWMGVNSAREWATRYGFEPQRQPDNLTLALGTGSTTPMQLASAYGVIANGGHLLPPQLIREVRTASGEVLFQAPPLALDEATRVIPARNAFLTASLLQDVTRTGTAARTQATLKRADLYGKTGTTNDVVDAWFAGFQPQRVAVVWLGYDSPRSLGTHASGASLAVPVWIDYMQAALKGVPVAELLPPPDGSVVPAGADWRYAEWLDGAEGFVPSIGVDAAGPAPEPH